VIDIHTHLTAVVDYYDRDPDLERAAKAVFGYPDPTQRLETYLSSLDDAGVERAVVLPLDCTTAHGCRIYSNELVAEIVRENPRLIGFASVDPNRDDAPSVLQHAVTQLGLRGLKLDPALQAFDLDDPVRAFPLYDLCVDLGIPLLIHCGMSLAPSGRSSRANPLALESGLHAFPGLRVVIAHCGWPWVDEALMLAIRFRGVYLDTAIMYSGAPIDSVGHVLRDVIGLDVVRRSLADRLVFGSGTPRVRARPMVNAIRALGLDAGIEARILRSNAAELLGLEEAGR
jgi:predicted TIM-barrel fold metal-dependent hydrolase